MDRVAPDDRVATGFARLALWLVVAYLIASRVIADTHTLPIGVSLHPTDLILAALLGTWLLWMVTDPQPFPLGIVSVLGALLVLVLFIMPFLNALGMSEFEANGAERGLVRAMLYAGLFIACYQLALTRRSAVRILTATVAVTLFQALLAIYEAVFGVPLAILDSIWQSVGLEVDPRATRTAAATLQQRVTGELRASATAPHPLVLAGLLAVGVGICIAFYLYSDSRRTRRLLLIAIVLQLLAVGATNQRTGFVMLAAIGLVIVLTQIHKVPSAFPLLVALVIGGAAVSVVSPNTLRLILNFVTGQQTDHNVAVRTSKYDALPELIERRPWLGAGYETGDPDLVTFDNAYLTQLVELGIIGLAVLLVFLLVVTGRCFASLRRADRADQVILLSAVLAAVSLFSGMTTFDVMSFAQFFPVSLIVMALGLARADELRRRGLREPADQTREAKRESP